MREEKVIVRIKKDGSGEMSIEGENFQGDGCDILKDVENSLGMITDTELKDEAGLYINPDLAFNELGID